MDVFFNTFVLIRISNKIDSKNGASEKKKKKRVVCSYANLY